MRTKLTDRIFGASLRDVGAGISRGLYKITRQSALDQIAREVGARQATVEAIAEAKAYDELGPTEISLMPGKFTDQPKQNLEILAGLYETHPWTFICTSYTATALAGIPLRAKRKTGVDEQGKIITEWADESPVGQMLQWINPAQSPYDFVESLVAWLLLTGEAYIAYVTPSGTGPPGIPAEMWVLFSPFVRKVVSPMFGIIGYEYNIGGQVAYFDAEDVVYFKTFSPMGRFRGQGTPVASIKTISTDQELREFNRNVLRQGVHISGVLETDNEDLKPDAAAKIRNTFEQQYAGSAKAHKVAVLWGGLKFNPTTILQKDVMMPEQITAAANEVIATFGYKPELLTEKFANKATAETVRRMAYEDTILGRHGKRIISTFNSTGLRRFGDEYLVEFDSADVPALQTSMGEKVEVGAKAIDSGQMTPNEVRTKIHNFEPLGSELDIPLYRGKPIDQIVEPPEPTAPPASGSFGNEDEDDNANGKKLARVFPGSTREVVLLTSGAVSGVEFKAEVDFEIVFERNRKLAEDRVRRALGSIYRDLRKELRPIVSRSTTFAEVMVEIEKIFLFDGRDVIVADLDDALRKAIDESVGLQLAHLKIEGAVDIKPVRALKRLQQQEQRVRNMWGRDWISLRRNIGEGLSLGESEAKLAGRVNTFFDGRRNNALTIARTETTSAINAAANDVGIQAIKAGVDIVSVWVTNQDEKVRQPPRDSKNHAQAHGLTIVPGEEMFVVSGERLEYPGDSWNGASPDNTINCRCGIRNEVRKVRASDNRRAVA